MLITEKVIIKTKLEEKIKIKIKNILENLTKESIKKLKGNLSNNSIPDFILNQLAEFESNKVKKILKKENVFFNSNLFNEVKEQTFFKGSDYYYVLDKVRVGKGGSCGIFECLDRNNNKYALKLLNNEKRKNQFEKEIKFLKKYKHENIIKLVDYDIRNYNFYIMPIYNMTLEDFIKEIHEELKIENVEKEFKFTKIENYFKILNSLTNACYYLKEISYYHLDIKEENILINEENGSIKNVVVSDFGCVTSEEKVAYQCIGNNKTMPPEYYTGDLCKDVKGYDIYSLGLIFNKILTQEYPRGVDYKEISDQYEGFSIIDFIIKNILFQNSNNRIDINALKNVMVLLNELYNFKNFKNLEFQKIKPFKNNFEFDIEHPFSTKKIKFKVDFVKNKKKEYFFNTIIAKEVLCDTNNQIKYPYVCDSWIDESIKFVNFYNFEDYLLFEKKYDECSYLSLWPKRKILCNLNILFTYRFNESYSPFHNKKDKFFVNDSDQEIVQFKTILNNHEFLFIFIPWALRPKHAGSLYLSIYGKFFKIGFNKEVLEKIISLK